MYCAANGAQVSRKNMNRAPQWLLDKAVKEELENAWESAFEEVNDSEVPFSSHVISSHTVYKVR